MRDPDSPIFQFWQELMATGDMTGRNRPVGRITVGKNRMRRYSNRERPGFSRTMLFEQPRQVELGYVKSINIDRDTDQDSATCTIELYNDSMLHNAYAPQGLDTGIGRPGYRSLERGTSSPIGDRSVYDRFSHLTGRDYPTEWDYPFPDADPDPWYKEWTHPDTGETFVGRRAYDGGSGQYAGGTRNWNRQLLMPNRVIRTFQGYGSDNFDADGHPHVPGDEGYVAPFDDTRLVQTGVWMIDRVVFGVDGLIQVECRDVAKVLLEQFIYPDMIHMERFPLMYCPVSEWTETETINVEAGDPGPNVIVGLGAPPGHYQSSNDPWVGRNASVFGHRPSHAFDGNADTYWLSVGNASPTADYAYEYVTGNARGDRVNQVVVNTVSTGYLAYVSIYEDGQWKGSDTIPYNPGASPAFPNGANIRYVRRFTITESGNQVLNLPATYDAQFVRVTLHRLWNSRLGTYPYRGAIRTLRARYRRPARTDTRTRNRTDLGEPEKITDWSEAIRELCAWGGLTWYASRDLYPGVQADPLLGHDTPSGWLVGEWGNDNYYYQSEALVRERIQDIRANRQLPADPESDEIWVQRIYHWGTWKIGDARTAITNKAIEYHGVTPLRVWGDIEWLGAGPIICTQPEFFVNKSFMEAINLVTNMIGALFFIDESGGAVFRMPNIFSAGNFRSGNLSLDVYNEMRLTHDPVEYYMWGHWPIEFHENANLIDYQVVVDDSAVRSEILVVGEPPDTESESIIAGGYVLGFNPESGENSAIDFTEVLAGQTRLFLVPGDDTKNFNTYEECQRMAELTALKILFTYRSGQLTAPVHPGLQIDDQVRIFERMTHEYNVHYVSGLSTRMDLETGEWIMNATTHWLGTDPRQGPGLIGGDFDNWFINTVELTPAVKRLPAIERRLSEAQ